MMVDPAPTPSRDLLGLDLVDALEAWTEFSAGWIVAPVTAQGDDPIYPYYTVTGHPGELTYGRPFLNPASGADFHFDIEAVGITDRQAAMALAVAVEAITGRATSKEYINTWTGTPAPACREVVAYGPSGVDTAARKNADNGIRWARVEVRLPVLL